MQDGLHVFQITLNPEYDERYECVRCKEMCFDLDLHDSYVGKLCDKCYATVLTRVRQLQKRKKNCPAPGAKNYIFYKGNHHTDKPIPKIYNTHFEWLKVQRRK
jgi:hypothetical protein